MDTAAADTDVTHVLFYSSFRLSSSPNIAHALAPDGTRTVCGRTGWVTNEGPQPVDTTDCLRCRKKLGLDGASLPGR